MRLGETHLVRLIGEPKTCLVRECGDGNGTFEILSPAVGLYDRPPAVGTFVQPGSFAGYLTILRRTYHLLIPEGHRGIVTGLQVSSRKERVEYGQALCRVSPETRTFLEAETARTEARESSPGEEIPEGMFGVRSPTDGIFYRQPNPQSPAYVEEGMTISQGAVLALVEVMKCFNPIVYPGEPEFPRQARVVRIALRDSSEVRHGALLFVVEPVI